MLMYGGVIRTPFILALMHAISENEVLFVLYMRGHLPLSMVAKKKMSCGEHIKGLLP